MPPTNEALASDVVSLLRELLHALLASSVPTWVDLQLTVPQLRTVFIIAHGETSSVSNVARHLGVGEPTASHLIEKLVQAGLVERTEDPQDRRRALVRLAPGGEKLIGKLLGWEDLLGEHLNKISASDLSNFRQGLSAIVDELHRSSSKDKKDRQAPNA